MKEDGALTEGRQVEVVLPEVEATVLQHPQPIRNLPSKNNLPMKEKNGRLLLRVATFWKKDGIQKTRPPTTGETRRRVFPTSALSTIGRIDEGETTLSRATALKGATTKKDHRTKKTG